MNGDSQSRLSNLDRVQKRLRGLLSDEFFPIMQFLCHRRNVSSLSLLYIYFHEICQDGLYYFLTPFQIFSSGTPYVTWTHPHALRIPFVRRKFHVDVFFPRTVALWNMLPGECFHEHQHLKYIMSRVNLYLSHICSSYAPLFSSLEKVNLVNPLHLHWVNN